MRTICIIQARLGSMRFPRKVLAEIKGTPMVQHVLDRAMSIAGIEEVVLAVPSREQEWRHYPHPQIWFHSGNVWDVVGRFVTAARAHDAYIIMRLTGDCPLIAPEVCEATLACVQNRSVNYATNDTRVSGYPDGLDVQVFTVDVLERADKETQDREHVCSWMDQDNEVRRFIVQAGYTGLPQIKLSVDTPEDLERIRTIYEYLEPEQFSFAATKKAIEEALRHGKRLA